MVKRGSPLAITTTNPTKNDNGGPGTNPQPLGARPFFCVPLPPEIEKKAVPKSLPSQYCITVCTTVLQTTHCSKAWCRRQPVTTLLFILSMHTFSHPPGYSQRLYTTSTISGSRCPEQKSACASAAGGEGERGSVEGGAIRNIVFAMEKTKNKNNQKKKSTLVRKKRNVDGRMNKLKGNKQKGNYTPMILQLLLLNVVCLLLRCTQERKHHTHTSTKQHKKYCTTTICVCCSQPFDLITQPCTLFVHTHPTACRWLCLQPARLGETAGGKTHR